MASSRLAGRARVIARAAWTYPLVAFLGALAGAFFMLAKHTHIVRQAWRRT